MQVLITATTSQEFEFKVNQRLNEGYSVVPETLVISPIHDRTAFESMETHVFVVVVRYP